MKHKWITLVLVGITVLGAAAYGEDPARPGTLNYVEGTAYLQGKLLSSKDIGSTELKTGQMLTTGDGKAEMLLTPGVFLRIDDNSAIRMVSPRLMQTQIELVQGKAAVEVDDIHKDNDLEIIVGGVRTQMIQNGYYEFDANHPMAMVFKGKAAVATGNDKYKLIKASQEFALSDNLSGKPSHFDEAANEGELYKWSNLRSEYLAEANNQMAGDYADAGGYAPGWFWDPYGFDYTYIGMGPMWSPFGFGFYPFGYGGFYGGGFYGGGFYGRGGYGRGGYGGGVGRPGFGGGVAHVGGGMRGGGGGRR
uniref:FecR protein domain-containing protein n=1 Tax=mine drainage metagenome TaxID=410659 RepID=E6PXD7_9ZZZZ